jgi:hypothetical protein
MTAPHLVLGSLPGAPSVHPLEESDREASLAPGESGGASRLLLSLLILLFLAIPATSVAYQQRLILAVEAGKCELRLEADDEARSLRLRVHPESSGCRVSREDVQRLLQEAFSKTDPPKLEGTYSSLFIGRLVDFPWLASYLASAAAEDSRWDKRRGKPVSMGLNAYVAMLLSSREVTTPLEAPIQGSGYRITSAIVEKVLVSEPRDAGPRDGGKSPGRVPFDAMVWFRLEKS